MFKDIGNFFSNIWGNYIDFMSGIFGYGLSIGITVVFGFVILSLIFLAVTNNRK